MATQEQAFNFTRASTKWVWNSTGTLVEVPVDQPAYDHDPVTGEPLGVLIEPSATNKVENSSLFYPVGIFETASFEERGLSFTEFTPEAGSGGLDNLYCGVRLAPRGLAHEPGDVISVYFKPTGVTRVNFRRESSGVGPIVVGSFDLAAETATVGSVENLGGGLYRLKSIPTESGTTLERSYIITVDSDQADGVNSFALAGHQVELGPVATSYIPTAGAPVTRAADYMSRDLGAEFNPNEGTFIIEADAEKSPQFGVFLKVSYSQYAKITGDFVNIWMWDDRVTVSGVSARQRGPSVSGRFVAAVSYSKLQNSLWFVVDGTVVGNPSFAGYSGDVNLLKAYLFSGRAEATSTVDNNTHGVKFSHYPYAMTEAELIELTTLPEE